MSIISNSGRAAITVQAWTCLSQCHVSYIQALPTVLMLWRISHSSTLDTYLHGDKPGAVVLYSKASESLCSALCGKLLARGFDLVILALDHSGQSNMHEHLKSAYPKRNVVFIAVREADTEDSTRVFSDMEHSWTTTLFIGCVDASIQSGVGPESSAQETSSIQLFTELQKKALPHLTRNVPSALLITANTLTPSLEENSEFFKAFASGLSSQLQSHGHDKTDVAFMEYFDSSCHGSTSSFLSPPPEVLADSILQALGQKSTHVIPYWPHELLAWFIWCLMLFLPSAYVIKLAPS